MEWHPDTVQLEDGSKTVLLIGGAGCGSGCYKVVISENGGASNIAHSVVTLCQMKSAGTQLCRLNMLDKSQPTRRRPRNF